MGAKTGAQQNLSGFPEGRRSSQILFVWGLLSVEPRGRTYGVQDTAGILFYAFFRCFAASIVAIAATDVNDVCSSATLRSSYTTALLLHFVLQLSIYYGSRTLRQIAALLENHKSLSNKSMSSDGGQDVNLLTRYLPHYCNEIWWPNIKISCSPLNLLIGHH
ncbi:hypothetical protein GDO78_004147 [Eleutherodactylus coqui]|uniref:Uncharacterized protein n=1 Tax=Eleutherodactylus coqui TaxID=57060 RepID=A0A8J6K389_ELECQ|nr:hypothetical protein GDO78_004147 [Eleutherodactylus coqui]